MPFQKIFVLEAVSCFEHLDLGYIFLDNPERLLVVIQGKMAYKYIMSGQ
jgi:hypothetical protein